MKRRMIKTAAQLTLASMAALAMTACWGEKPAPPLALTAYAKPDHWATECAGRWLVDVPAPINFGVAKFKFNIEETGTHMLDVEARHLGLGSMKLATFDVLEYAPAPRESFLNPVHKTLNFSYPDVYRDKYFDDDKDWAQKHTKQLKTTSADAVAWHSANIYDLVFYQEADRRVRRFRGDISGENPRIYINPEVAKKTAAQAQIMVNNIWPRYQVRKPGDIPTQAGICTPYGFFADPKDSSEQDYHFAMPLRDPRHSNLVLSLEIASRPALKLATPEQPAEALTIEETPTPWAVEEAWSQEEKAKCRPQQGTASRDLLGCMFAGGKNIKSHRPVQYLTLANGQKARLLVLEYATGEVSGSVPYVVRLQTAGTPLSASEPRITIQATAQAANAQEAVFKGKNPPSIDQTVALVVGMAQSLRPRPGALAAGVPVKDSMAGLR
jgi:hypothetical protein